MKRLFILTCLLAVSAAPLPAQQAGSFGAGLILGNPTGATGKFWVDGSRALDGGVGFGHDLSLYGDYLWHSWKVLPQPSEGKLPVYLGVGAQLRSASTDAFGLRAVAGIAYWLPRDPVEIFLDLVPVLHFSSGASDEVMASIGLRYYFKPG